MNRRLGCPALVIAAGLVLAGCGGASSSSSAKPELKVTGAYMPAPPTSDLAAGFFTVSNSGGADTLTSVTSGLAGDVTLHSTKDGAMEEEKSFAVPVDGRLDFASGGNHLMFEKLTHKPKQGEKVSVQLHFAKSGTVTVEMPVESPTYNPKTGH
ncbi:copper chaperone PCu(A)C [Streptomyces chiangmaiensis]|uniref:Copper chaperone PCu(A)C n=1 Tax=Streptomyces chiangmaiensis TaxID=766497 RepID=A0ABU7FGC2_9ACTN|nr:copper chaperone PCu(A)C [Streptomyces chiangmaiensis]MED7822408.1 copper chaperone PCu(A)C [Streptomyces chiangmaiensis]